MRVVRQRMIKPFNKILSMERIASLVTLVALASCNPTEIASSGQRNGVVINDGTLSNKAYIYRDSPAILEGPNYSPNNVDMSGSTDFRVPEFIANKTQLKGDCTINFFTGSETTVDCLHSYASKVASQQLLPRRSDGTWVFPPNSSEFYQVNGLYHVQQGVNTFFEKLKFAYDHLHSTLAPWTPKSTPAYLNQTDLYWFKAIAPTSDNYFRNSFLSSYALCNLELNAQFNPAGPELCFGKWSNHPTFFFVQDPTIIYHELGHALIAVMMNFRNGIPATPTPSYHALRSNLGGYGYDEAGSIGEGIADYYSYVMNARPHIGEWALGKSFNASRPMHEDDALHISAVSATPEGRLSYPQYLLYDPNEPDVPYEDVHYAGQIVSHYLVALTESLKNECSMPTDSAHSTSTSYVMLLLAETFAELGDLNAVGLDNYGMAYNPVTFPYRFNNLDEKSSYLWAHVINPPTYRRFFQIMGKNIYKYITNGLCSGFTQDESEKLLDDYGLLLFKTYNDNGNSTKNVNIQYNSYGVVGTYVTPIPPTTVHESNRRKSVLVSKELLSLAETDTDANVATYYIIDDRSNIQAVLENLLFKGFPINLSSNVASVDYNNSNIRISPGEIVAIIPNLKNTSNSTMAGIHLLATDWDHAHITDTTGNNGNFKPCVVDDVTTVAQGAESGLSCTNLLTDYRRHVKNSSGLFRTDEVVAPVCLVQLEEGETTRWVSQNEFRKKQGLALQDKDCLGYEGTASTEDFTFNPHECLIRALPGANEAYFSKIDPQKSYIETMRNGNPDHSFGPGNALLFEVNKWIPPGTKFRCRLRAKFSNCSDCFSDPTDTTKDDYIDAEYNGAKPYKIINVEFTVND